MTNVAPSMRDDCYGAVAFYLRGAQNACMYAAYADAAALLMCALEPVNAFSASLTVEERAFIRKFIHDCIDEMSKLVTAEIDAVTDEIEPVLDTIRQAIRDGATVQTAIASSGRRAQMSKHLN